jgi:16S rRNA (guanine966-N2)-methyltransferase
MRIIAGEYKGRVLKTTTGPGFCPAMGKVREALFSMLEAHGVDWPEARVLDLFAGSGSLGFEALSRGAAFTCFVESAPYAAKVISANAELLDVAADRMTVVREEAFKALARRPAAPYSVIFIDPPYQMDVLGHTLRLLLRNRWVADYAVINAEVEVHRRFDPAAFDPLKAHPDISLLADRTYGQTRVILWNANPQ